MKYDTGILLTQGATGEIYRAWDSTLNRYVALKFLRRGDPEAVERMLREARAQARIQHEHVCQVYEIGEQDGRPFIAMQYIDGDELGVTARRMTLERKVRLMMQVAEALHAAHQLGLVHRDVKPANIMVEQTADGELKPSVVDFGLVQDDEAEGLTHTGEVMGTPWYMAPEQATGEHGRVDRRTDVYGLGATLYQLLVGEPPFAGSNRVEVLMRVLNQDPEPPRRRDPGIPAELETIVLKCLEKEPQRRYGSARALAEDLRAWLEGRPITARPPTLTARFLKVARRHRTLVTVSAALIAVILALGALAVHLRWRSLRQAELTQRFVAEGKDLEWKMRAVHMSPRHDIRPEKRLVRQRLQEIDAELARVGSLGAGPAHHALGVGHLALYEDERAREHLEKAWELEHRTPELGYALGLALGRLYERELNRLQNLSDEALRRDRKREIDAALRDPAMRYLAVSRGADTAAPEYVEGLLALYDRRYAEARAKARQALARLSWLYEARILEGNAWLAEAHDRRNAGDVPGALKLYGRGEETFRAAIAAAPSAPRALAGLCTLRTAVVYATHRGAGERLREDLDAAVAACEAATAVDPEAPVPWAEKADALRMWAQYQTWHGQDPVPALERAVASARRGIAADDRHAASHQALGFAFLQRAERHIFLRRGDPLPWLDRAAASFRRVLELEPDSPQALNGLGAAEMHRAEGLNLRGRDGSRAVAAGIQVLERALRITPDAYGPRMNLAGLRLYQSREEARKGLDFWPALVAAEKDYRKGLEVRPEDPWAFSNLSRVYMEQAGYQFATGGDPRGALAKAQEAADRSIALDPGLGWFYNRRAEIQGLSGWIALLSGEDPAPYLRKAWPDVARTLEINPGQPTGYALGMVLELTAARGEMARGRSPAAAFERSRRYLDGFLQRAEGDAVHQAWGDFLRWRAEWRVAIGAGDAGRDVAQGLEHVRLALLADPDSAALGAQRGAFHLLRARLERDPEARKAAARQAWADLDRALSVNRWLAPEYEALRGEARRLAGAVVVVEPRP